MKSELPLRRLNAAAGVRGELRIEAAAGPLSPGGAAPVGVLEDESGRRWYASYELDGGACLLELPPTANFLLEPEAGRIAVERLGRDEELLEHRIASSAVCTLLAMRGDLALHASGVEVDGRAVLFCGPTQRGKSTLARGLGEAGRPLLGEDGIVVALGEDGPLAFPGARGVRARRDGGVELLPDPGPAQPAPCPPAAIVLLGERGAALEVEPLAPSRALALLTPNLIHSGARAAIAVAFAGLARLLRATPAFSARLPDDLDALPAAADDMLDTVAVRG